MALTPKTKSDIVIGAGGLLLMVGVGLVYLPAALIIAGALVLAYGLLAIKVDR